MEGLLYINLLGLVLVAKASKFEIKLLQFLFYLEQIFIQLNKKTCRLFSSSCRILITFWCLKLMILLLGQLVYPSPILMFSKFLFPTLRSLFCTILGEGRRISWVQILKNWVSGQQFLFDFAQYRTCWLFSLKFVDRSKNVYFGIGPTSLLLGSRPFYSAGPIYLI